MYACDGVRVHTVIIRVEVTVSPLISLENLIIVCLQTYFTMHHTGSTSGILYALRQVLDVVGRYRSVVPLSRVNSERPTLSDVLGGCGVAPAPKLDTSNYEAFPPYWERRPLTAAQVCISCVHCACWCVCDIVGACV